MDTAVTPLIQRYQALQFARDQAFYACVAYLNGVMNEAEYREVMMNNGVAAAALLAFEIEARGNEQQTKTNIRADLESISKKLKDIEDLVQPRKK